MPHNDIPHARPVAIIAPTQRGGWAMLLPSAGIPLGNYPTPQDAARAAMRNGFATEIQEATTCQR